MDDWRNAEATFREFQLIADRLKKPHPELLRICVRSLVSGFDTIASSLKRMAARAAAKKNTEISPREQNVLFDYAEPPYPGAPPRRIETSTRESLNVAIVVYARARGSEPPMDTSPLGDPAIPAAFAGTLTIFDRICHPEELTALEVTKSDIVMLQKTLKWADSLRKWLGRERLAEIEEVREEIEISFEEARQKLRRRQP